MTYVLLGNVAPLGGDGSPSITQVTMREGWDDLAYVRLALSTDNDPVLNQIRERLEDHPDYLKIGVLEIADLWQYHAAPGDLPEWVESDDEDFAEAISEWFSVDGHECTVDRPDDWEEV